MHIKYKFNATFLLKHLFLVLFFYIKTYFQIKKTLQRESFKILVLSCKCSLKSKI